MTHRTPMTDTETREQVDRMRELIHFRDGSAEWKPLAEVMPHLAERHPEIHAAALARKTDDGELQATEWIWVERWELEDADHRLGISPDGYGPDGVCYAYTACVTGEFTADMSWDSRVRAYAGGVGSCEDPYLALEEARDEFWKAVADRLKKKGHDLDAVRKRAGRYRKRLARRSEPTKGVRASPPRAEQQEMFA